MIPESCFGCPRELKLRHKDWLFLDSLSIFETGSDLIAKMDYVRPVSRALVFRVNNYLQFVKLYSDVLFYIFLFQQTCIDCFKSDDI